VYACLSSRTHLDALGDFAQRMEYDVVAFDAVDRDGVPIYHTNVLMNVGEEIAVVCDVSIKRDEQRRAVLERLEATGHTVICLDFDQLDAFAGNMLEVRNADGERVVAMSQQAFDSLRRDQVELLSRNGRIATAKIDDFPETAVLLRQRLTTSRHPPAAAYAACLRKCIYRAAQADRYL
jgi:hypothetical protein